MISSNTASSATGFRRFEIPVRYWLVPGMFLLAVLLYVDRVCISSAKDYGVGNFKYGPN